MINENEYGLLYLEILVFLWQISQRPDVYIDDCLIGWEEYIELIISLYTIWCSTKGSQK